MALEGDARKVPERKSSYAVDDLSGDKFELPLPTELIPDEYQHVENKNGLVYVIRGNKKSDWTNTTEICEKLQGLGYNVPDENVHIIESKKDVLLFLKRISEKNHSEKSCLIVIFLGEVKKDDRFVTDTDTISMTEVWSPFIKCPSLKSTPKIFIFQASKFEEQMGKDGHVFATAAAGVYGPEHDVPTEADLLVVYKKIEGPAEAKLKFIRDLCKEIDLYGKRDDLIGLITRMEHDDSQPVIISTLTKKFYLSSSIYRDYYYDLKEMGSLIMDKIDYMGGRVELLEKGRKKNRSSFRRVVDAFKSRRENVKSPEPPETSRVQEQRNTVVTDSVKTETPYTSLKRKGSKKTTPTPARHWYP